jgi:hypothetical protein
MRLINDKKAHTVQYGKQAPIDEIVVGQSLWRDQEHVELVSKQSTFDARPIRLIRRIDRFCSHADISSGFDLVPHQRQKRRDEERAARTLIAKESRGKKVHNTLAPPGSLNDQEPSVPLDQCGNGLELSIAELRVSISEGFSKLTKCLSQHIAAGTGPTSFPN